MTSSLSSTMQAVVATPDGESWTERRVVDVPSPGPGKLLLRVRAFSVNRGELHLVRSRGEGWRPGQDVAGEVVAAGPGTELPAGVALGARVAGLADWHTWAEYALVDANRVAALPDGVDDGIGAALPGAGLTALNAVRRGGSLLGVRVLVTGASGGVGLAAVQLAAASGARVTGVARAERAAAVQAAGAVEVVADVADAAGPFALICEGVGGATLTKAIGTLAETGVAVLYGATDAVPAELSLFAFADAPGARVEPFFSGRYHASNGADLATLLALVADGRLTVTLGYDAGWDELNAAMDAFAARAFAGKAVLRVP